MTKPLFNWMRAYDYDTCKQNDEKASQSIDSVL